MKKKTSLVITTIAGSDNKILNTIADGCKKHDWDLIITGDRKSPGNFSLKGAHYQSIEDQHNLNYTLVDLLPENHYCRKNIGSALLILDYK